MLWIFSTLQDYFVHHWVDCLIYLADHSLVYIIPHCKGFASICAHISYCTQHVFYIQVFFEYHFILGVHFKSEFLSFLFLSSNIFFYKKTNSDSLSFWVRVYIDLHHGDSWPDLKKVKLDFSPTTFRLNSWYHFNE